MKKSFKFCDLKIVSLIILFCLCTTVLPLSAESGLSQRVMTLWTEREGLPSDSILDVVQDSLGYIWLASYEGLTRFDGSSFTIFNAKQDGFTGNNPRVLEVGKDGSVWIGTNTVGLFRYKEGSFVKYGKEQGLLDLSIRSLAFDSDGVLFVGTAKGIFKLVNNYFEAVLPQLNNEFGIANFLLPLDDGRVIAGTNLSGLWTVSSRGLESYLDTPELGSLSFSAGFIDRKGYLWLGTSNGQIFKVYQNTIRERFTIPELAGSSINTFYADTDGFLWVGTDKGVVIISGSQVSFFTEDNGLPSNVVSSFWQDTENNLWIGTERGGLVKFSKGKFLNISKKDGLIAESVNAIVEDVYQSLWVATDEGVFFFPSLTDPYHIDAVRQNFVDSIIKKLHKIRVRQIRYEKDKSLWFSTYSDLGLYVVYTDGTERSFTKKEGLPINRVRFSYRASNNDLWVGTTAGPVLFKEGSFDHPEVFTSESGLSNLFILGATEDHKGTIWLGTDGGGLARFDGQSFKMFTTADGLTGNVVFRILEDASHRFWVSTSEGLCLLENDKFFKVNHSLALENESVFEVLNDTSDRLWIICGRKVILSSSDDLALAAKNQKELTSLKRFDKFDGLSGQLSANAWGFVTEKGVVHIPTLKGVSTYNPLTVDLNTVVPPVIIENIYLDSVKINPKDLMVVNPSVRRVSFRFTALSYVIPERVKIYYLLEGYDKDWIYAGTNREASYTNLSRGSYTFKVKAENNDGVFNISGSSVKFTKKSYFYQTIYFYLFLIFVVAFIVYFFVRIRFLAAKRRTELLNKLVADKTEQLEIEKEKSENLLGNVLPPPVALELRNTGQFTPVTYQNIGVLFSDIVCFTPWAASVGPEDVICELNDIFTAFDMIMEKNNCERIKTLGDGYLAVSSLERNDSESIKNLVQAGIDMLTWVDSKNSNSQTKHEIRVGITMGSIVGGVVGVRKFIFDIFGDTVNTAFRLEASSVPMGLTVSENIAQLLKESFYFIERPPRIIKGKGATAPYYVRWRKVFGNAYSIKELASQMTELETLLNAQRHAECVEKIKTIDLTLVEPENGFKLFNMLKLCYEALGDTEKVYESERAALCIKQQYHQDCDT